MGIKHQEMKNKILLLAILIVSTASTHTVHPVREVAAFPSLSSITTDPIACEEEKRALIPSLKLPYAEAGLTKRQAAAHLLDRFAFGARPNDIDKVVETGLENWLTAQLSNDEARSKLAEKLAAFKTLTMPTAEIAARYPNPGILLAQAYKDGVISKIDTAGANRAELRRKIFEYYKKEGVRPQRELIQELLSQKLLRATYSENQLAEVLTDFWFNHEKSSQRLCDELRARRDSSVCFRKVPRYAWRDGEASGDVALSR